MVTPNDNTLFGLTSTEWFLCSVNKNLHQFRPWASRGFCTVVSRSLTEGFIFFQQVWLVISLDFMSLIFFFSNGHRFSSFFPCLFQSNFFFSFLISNSYATGKWILLIHVSYHKQDVQLTLERNKDMNWKLVLLGYDRNHLLDHVMIHLSFWYLFKECFNYLDFFPQNF